MLLYFFIFLLESLIFQCRNFTYCTLKNFDLFFVRIIHFRLLLHTEWFYYGCIIIVGVLICYSEILCSRHSRPNSFITSPCVMPSCCLTRRSRTSFEYCFTKRLYADGCALFFDVPSGFTSINLSLHRPHRCRMVSTLLEWRPIVKEQFGLTHAQLYLYRIS